MRRTWSAQRVDSHVYSLAFPGPLLLMSERREVFSGFEGIRVFRVLGLTWQVPRLRRGTKSFPSTTEVQWGARARLRSSVLAAADPKP
eukprot:716624-Prorocentrum_minimum.AAC.1